MPIYEVACPNPECREFDSVVEVFCKCEDRDKQVCGTCGTAVNRLPSRVVLDRQFHGTTESTSVAHMFHPSEVGDAKKLFRDGTIHDNGLVTFSSRSEERRFTKRMNEINAPVRQAVESVNKASIEKRRQGTRTTAFKRGYEARRAARRS